MISVFGWPDPNMAFDQSEHALHTCYFIIIYLNGLRLINEEVPLSDVSILF